MNYILTWHRAGLPKQYLCHIGDFTQAKELAQKFTADDAIAKQNLFAGMSVPRVVCIEFSANNLSEQLTTLSRSALATIVGGDPKAEQFESILRATPALPDGWKASDAARAYVETLLRTLTK